jgi:hypothetical protein
MAPAVRREADEDWGRKRNNRPTLLSEDPDYFVAAPRRGSAVQKAPSLVSLRRESVSPLRPDALQQLFEVHILWPGIEIAGETHGAQLRVSVARDLLRRRSSILSAVAGRQPTRPKNCAANG